MRIDVLTTLPELMEGPLSHSIIHRARQNGLVEIIFHNLRDFSKDKHRNTDDYGFGGDAGMVMCIQPIFDAINQLKSERSYQHIIYLSPDGELFNQNMANQLSLSGNMIMLCGHYKGVDHRVRDHLISLEISIGDYVLTGGELAAAVVIDALVRLIPGAMSDETSALTDSFQDKLLAPPVYTRPAEFNGWKVPDILLSGNFAKIRDWQFEQSLDRTQRLRPDLLNEKD